MFSVPKQARAASLRWMCKSSHHNESQDLSPQSATPELHLSSKLQRVHELGRCTCTTPSSLGGTSRSGSTGNTRSRSAGDCPNARCFKAGEVHFWPDRSQL